MPIVSSPVNFFIPHISPIPLSLSSPSHGDSTRRHRISDPPPRVRGSTHPPNSLRDPRELPPDPLLLPGQWWFNGFGNGCRWMPQNGTFVRLEQWQTIIMILGVPYAGCFNYRWAAEYESVGIIMVITVSDWTGVWNHEPMIAMWLPRGSSQKNLGASRIWASRAFWKIHYGQSNLKPAIFCPPHDLKAQLDIGSSNMGLPMPIGGIEQLFGPPFWSLNCIYLNLPMYIYIYNIYIYIYISSSTRLVFVQPICRVLLLYCNYPFSLKERTIFKHGLNITYASSAFQCLTLHPCFRIKIAAIYKT